MTSNERDRRSGAGFGAGVNPFGFPAMDFGMGMWPQMPQMPQWPGMPQWPAMGAGMAAWPEMPGFSGMGAPAGFAAQQPGGAGDMAKRMARVNLEIMALVSRRTRAVIEAPQKFANCRSFEDMVAVQSLFMSEMLTDFMSANQRLMAVWFDGAPPAMMGAMMAGMPGYAPPPPQQQPQRPPAAAPEPQPAPVPPPAATPSPPSDAAVAAAAELILRQINGRMPQAAPAATAPRKRTTKRSDKPRAKSANAPASRPATVQQKSKRAGSPRQGTARRR